MTLPIKKYQNVSYQELLSYAEHNPNRHLVLEPIEIDIPQEEATLRTLGLNNHTASTITPAGILGILVCIADPAYYSLAPPNVRIQLVIDMATRLQQQTDELKNTALSRKRKKIYDLIGAAYNQGRFEDKDYVDLFHGISVLHQTHFVMMNEAVQDTIEEGGAHDAQSAIKGEIHFSSDPATWKQENPIWIVDYRGRWVATPLESDTRTYAAWLETIETMGWMVQWPEADGTKVELLEKLLALGQESDKKLSKDVLSARLGRLTSLGVLSQRSL